jgi:hypothetical protein
VAIHEPTITRVYQSPSSAGYVNDPTALHSGGVVVTMTDGTLWELYSGMAGAVQLPDDQLIGLTTPQAYDLAEKQGALLILQPRTQPRTNDRSAHWGRR